MINCRMFPLFILVLIGSAFFSSCGDSETPTSNDGDPMNLTVDIEILDDRSGAVIVTASADNAILYEFDMGTTATNDTGASESGIFEFVYENTGVFIVEVKAFGNNGRFLREEKQISVTSGEPSISGEGYSTPISYDGMNLLWNDEFDGSIVNQSDWTFETGNGCPNICGWGNNELEFYTVDNSDVRDGLLTITAREETIQSNRYSSSRLKTQDKFAFTYGRVDVRAKLPSGRGIWPAIWMLGQNISSVGWPRSGEIDIMEMIGGTERTTHGTAHWANANGDRVMDGGDRTIGVGLDEAFHVYTIIWDETAIRWFLDDNLYFTLDITGPDKQAFHNPFFLLLNVAVGGDWPGSPTADTVFPTSMQVDYVRVFQEQ